MTQPKEIPEEVRVVKRTELYNSILSIVKQIPRKEVEGDAMDAPSCAYKLQQLFLNWQEEHFNSLIEEKDKEILRLQNIVNGPCIACGKLKDKCTCTTTTNYLI